MDANNVCGIAQPYGEVAVRGFSLLFIRLLHLPHGAAAAAPFLSGLVFVVFMALVQDGVDQVLDSDKLAHLVPEFVGLGGCGFAFGLEFGTLCFPGFYGKGFTVPGEFTFGQVEAAEFWFVVLLKLLTAVFVFDILQLVMDGFGFCIGLRVALEFLEFLDPLTVAFHRILQRLTFRVDFCDFLL